MTIEDLIEQLLELREKLPDDIPVKLLTQPTYPIEHRLDRVGYIDPEHTAGKVIAIYLVTEETSSNYGPSFRDIDAWDLP